MRAKEKQLLEYLRKFHAGREGAVTGVELEKTFRISGTELRKLVHNLRIEGCPICSDRTGYFYPRTGGEVLATILQLQRMEVGIGRAIHGLVKSMDGFGPPGGGGMDR